MADTCLLVLWLMTLSMGSLHLANAGLLVVMY